jgi:methyltransferase
LANVGAIGRRLAVAIPDTVLEEHDSLRDKTAKLGLIARACAIYGVENVIVFKDEKGKKGESKLIKKVLEYLETPQYLRRRLYPLDESLRYAGLLPPLRIPSHKPKVPLDKVAVGEVREGVTNSDGTVDVGLERAARLKGAPGSNRRVTVRVVAQSPLTAELVRREEAGDYWGYAVEVRTIRETLSDDRFGLKIATSRYGNSLASLVFQLRESLVKSNSIMLVFGSPSRGLFDIVGPELSGAASFVVNLFPYQHVATVRTEEAIFAALNLVTVLTM